jgi:putative transposase
VASELNQELVSRITEVAHLRRRFGYRRIHDVLRSAYPEINHKRIYRLYAQAGLAVRKRRKVKRPSNERQPLLPASSINEVWSMDFVSDSLSNGRRLKLLTVTDDFSRECVDITVDYGISGEYVTRLLDRAALFRGYPEVFRFLCAGQVEQSVLASFSIRLAGVAGGSAPCIFRRHVTPSAG